MVKSIIVGIDIGTTTGIAIYDLNRNLLYTESKRYLSISSVIKQIMLFGKPLIIATDKEKTPSPINKLAASFNCKVFHPDHDLAVEEKDDIVKISIKDIHEKDALAAATFAYKSYAGQFNNIDRNLDSLGLRQYSDRVKEMIVKKEARNIAEAIEKIKPKKEEEKIEPKSVSREINLDWKEKAKEYDKKLNEEKNRYEILRVYTEKLEERLKNLERQKQEYLEEELKKNEDSRKEVLKEKEIRTRDILIRQLKFELSKQKSFKEAYEEELKRQQELEDIENEKLIPIIIISNFDKEAIINTHRQFDIKDKVVWVKNFSLSKIASKVLRSIKPKVVIGELNDETKEVLRDAGIIVIDNLTPEIRRYYAAISPEKIENTVKKIEKKNFLNWLEDYRKRQVT